ncbi:MAG: PD-(D/E)XK nuclease domain-containing protein [Tannerellaceae bacterium]|jgi:hypothetical protein|nr:PD-(D/E)XK nuclease domain-containing protein [Tannerellaceae bacterium]
MGKSTKASVSGLTICTTPQADSITDYRTGDNNPLLILYQTGYLTIKSYDAMFDAYVLGYPNEEVKYGFSWKLLPAYLPVERYELNDFFAGKFVKELMSGDVEGFMTDMRAFFATILYNLNDRTERHYQLLFYLLFTLMGQFVQTEVRSVRVRIDASVKNADTIYVFEFKISGNGTAEDALKQIDEKGYLIPYTANGRRIVKVGVEFSFAERGLSRWTLGRRQLDRMTSGR